MDAALTMPALVIHGDEDALVPLARGVELAEALPNGRMVTMQGAGHNFMVARGEQASAAVLDFISDAEKAMAPG